MEEVVGCLLGMAFLAVLSFGMACAIAWLACLVFTGFGVALPYWPTVGAVMLIELALSALRGGSSTS